MHLGRKLIAFGTFLYVVMFGLLCGVCMSPVILGTSSALSSATFMLCVVTYLLGVVPAWACASDHRSFRALTVGWAAAVLSVETLSHVVMYANDLTAITLETALNLALFIVWPIAAGLLALVVE